MNTYHKLCPNNMEKTYKFALPKNQEVERTQVRVENGNVYVDVKFKERFQPEDGDFLVSSNGKVFIYREERAIDKLVYGCYCGVDRLDIIHTELSNNWTQKAGCRFATSAEKGVFLAQLEKECNKRWNPETKTLEPIRWRAKIGEPYYAMNPEFKVAQYIEADVSTDDNRYNSGNYFQTAEEVQPYADKVKELFKTHDYGLGTRLYG